MCKLNKGEWSELYAIMTLLLHPKLLVVDSNLDKISDELYDLKKIKMVDSKLNSTFEYFLNDKLDVKVLLNNKYFSYVSRKELYENKEKLFNAIKNAPSGNRTFKVDSIKDILEKLSKSKSIKSKSSRKVDLEAVVVDKVLEKEVALTYSIKSSLGSPATILNSSKCTNFLYSVSGLSENDISSINKINTRKKLLDKIAFIKKHGGIIKFERVVNEIFDYNLKMVDSKMPDYLANVLIDSYAKNEGSIGW